MMQTNPQTPLPVATATATATPMTSAMAMQRLDVSAMHEKVMVIFNSIDVDIKPKDSMLFFVDVSGTNPSNAQQLRGNCMCCSASTNWSLCFTISVCCTA